MFNKSLLFYGLIVLPSAAPLYAEMSDPMRPANAVVTQSSAAPGKPRWAVTGILISPERRLAMINNRLLGVGDKVDGANVKAIHGNMVELNVDGRSVYLKPEMTSLRQAR